MNRFNTFFIFLFMFTVLSNFFCFAENSNQWVIDKELLFNFGYTPSHYMRASEIHNEPCKSPGCQHNRFELPESKGFTRDYLPDISNISLSGFLSLGFPVEKKEYPENYNFYIKLFDFPRAFKPSASSLPLVRGFLLDSMNQGSELTKFASFPENLAVKLCYTDFSNREFSPTAPYPILSIDTKNPSSQKDFNLRLPFSSIYVLPVSGKPSRSLKNKYAEWTSTGVIHFHRELLAIYQKNLIPLMSTKDSNHYYFLVPSSISSIRNSVRSTFTVIKIPVNPLQFKNWRELPMPQNPQRIFLTGLLLIERSVYLSQDNTLGMEKKSVEEITSSSSVKKMKSHILEVGSVVRQKI